MDSYKDGIIDEKTGLFLEMLSKNDSDDLCVNIRIDLGLYSGVGKRDMLYRGELIEPFPPIIPIVFTDINWTFGHLQIPMRDGLV